MKKPAGKPKREVVDHHRDVDPKSFEGKTVKRVDAHAVNIIKFEFTDGTKTSLETEAVGHGLIGIVQCDECADLCSPDGIPWVTDRPTVPGAYWVTQKLPKGEIVDCVRFVQHDGGLFTMKGYGVACFTKFAGPLATPAGLEEPSEPEPQEKRDLSDLKRLWPPGRPKTKRATKRK